MQPRINYTPSNTFVAVPLIGKPRAFMIPICSPASERGGDTELPASSPLGPAAPAWRRLEPQARGCSPSSHLLSSKGPARVLPMLTAAAMRWRPCSSGGPGGRDGGSVGLPLGHLDHRPGRDRPPRTPSGAHHPHRRIGGEGPTGMGKVCQALKTAIP